MRERFFISAFVLILITPALTQLAVDIAAGRAPLAFALSEGFKLDPGRFAAFEKRLEEEWPPTPKIRAAVQWLLLFGFREGNDKVLAAPSGWLVYRPGLAAIFGSGPFGGDVKSVAKPPPAIPWLSPFDAIVDFAYQLRARNIELVFVPVPDKVSIHPEIMPLGALQSSPSPLRHPDMPEFEQRLRRAGVTVLSLATMMRQAVSASTDEARLYLKTDTHWNKNGLDHAVDYLATHLAGSARQPIAVTSTVPVPRPGQGDLTRMLAGKEHVFGQELAGYWPAALRENEDASDVLILGDSFVNIYRDPALGFGSAGGLPELLGEKLGGRIDVIAINGGAATQVRRELARNPELLNGKRFVVWIIAERELCPSPPDSRTESTVWQRVHLPATGAEPRITAPPKGHESRPEARTTAQGELIIEGRVELTSAYLPPEEAPYRDCLGVMIYKIEKIQSGSFSDETIPVVHWIFKDEKLLPPARFAPGQRHTLTLRPFSQKPSDIQNIQRVDDSGDLRPLWWVEQWQ